MNPALHGPVLLATDGLGKSDAPIIAARLIAKHLGVPLEIVSVIEPQLLDPASLGGVSLYIPQLDEALRQSRLEAVKAYVARNWGSESPPIHLSFGSIPAEIARVAAERSATLIVVGAAAHQRMNHIVAGERAEYVLRLSTVPVLSVPPGFGTLPSHVLVAVDFSPASVRAAQTALLVTRNGGTLTLLHLLSPLLGDGPLRDVAGRETTNPAETLFGRLREELRPYVPAGITLETQLRSDYGGEGVVGAASALSADLVVVGTHGPRFLERLFVGSVAAGVLHNAEQAVLAAPPPPAAEALDLWRRITGSATATLPAD